jgi:hypothetical protein
LPRSNEEYFNYFLTNFLTNKKMAIIVSSKGSTTAREPIPAGAHAARCYSIIDLGTSEQLISGNQKVVRKIRITFELPTERRVFSEEKGEQPCVTSKEFTLSLADKSNLRAFLRSWRGKDFTEQEAAAFDVAKLIGAPCLLNIIHVAGKTNPSKMYDEISSVSPLPKGMVCPPQENPSFEFSVSEWNQEAFAEMPQFIREKIMASFEFRELMAQGIARPVTAGHNAAFPAAAPVAPAPAPAARVVAPTPPPAPAPFIDEDDDSDPLPF